MSCRAGRARPVSLFKPGLVELPVTIGSFELFVVFDEVEGQFSSCGQCLGVCPRSQQRFYSFGLPKVRRPMQRGVATFGSRFQVRPCGCQRSYGFGLPKVRRLTQWGAPFASRFQVRPPRLSALLWLRPSQSAPPNAAG